MGIKVALNHRTEYRYDRPITLGPQVVQLRPAPHCRTPILSYSLQVSPAQHFSNWQQDPHSNFLARFIFPEKTSGLVVEVDLAAELTPFNPFDFFLEPGAEEYPVKYSALLAQDLEPYRATGPAGARLQAFLDGVSREKRSSVGFLVDLNRKVRAEVGYVKRLDPGVQTPEQTLELGTGSCRDSAWLLAHVLRQTGIAARFVSGYLIQLAGGETPGETDSADLHAWAEAFLPGAGWIGLDPTSGLLTGEGHIPLVCTPHAANAAPIDGTAEPSGVDFGYTMSIRRMDEVASLAKPFTEADWIRVQQVAHKVDEELAAQDVRLTMGGEPTFVGIDEPESPQWNIEALGAMKRTRGLALIERIREKISLGALLHYGQGKWYPGEALPRWALSCYWRADGVPIWENAELIARDDRDYGLGTSDALRFITALMRRLQVSSSNLLSAFNPEPRVTEPAGYVFPIRRRQHKGRIFWSSQLWFDRPEPLLLFPGNSPIGYRLSLDALPWVTPDKIEYERENSPFAGLVKLPPNPTRRFDLFDPGPTDISFEDPLPPFAVEDESAAEQIRPALCVQARQGRLHVFLPYASELADYLDLLAAVEDTCEHLQTPVWIEGYTPPLDPRSRSFSITPDPGVLEVNLPPAGNWDELERIHTLVFEIARNHRLTAEKFTHDGRHIATGGGNHIVIGGATTADSPLLRRPGLLRSMLTFWQHHPSLSYLFSGIFVGPTSQYPRLDEARMDALYEVEIAFSQLPRGECPPEIVDGLFRNLLADMTGNTHRAEFCIDKLYPPPGRGLRLGLLELRAFEMAPHVRMGLLEMLLIRALVCMFWKRPLESGLVRWGTTLHDRFLLPYFVQQDFFEVLGILRQFGFNFEEQWFTPQLEFRFPKIGAFTAQGVQLELRQALEPWNVLAEETTSGGTARSVDSSLERVQVKISGLTSDSRYLVTCNGRRVPLHPTGEPGQAVAGVRFRARELSSSLHPTIPVHAPLMFEILDQWTKQSIGRCTYHIQAPGGREYSKRPMNATEAGGRRRERFEAAERTLTSAQIPPDEMNPVFPLTLDLRWLPPAQTDHATKPGDLQ